METSTRTSTTTLPGAVNAERPGWAAERPLLLGRATAGRGVGAVPSLETRGRIKLQASRITPSRLRTGATCESWSASKNRAGLADDADGRADETDARL
jgi:hypothetical protein